MMTPAAPAPGHPRTELVHEDNGRLAVDVDRREQSVEVGLEKRTDGRPRRVRDEQADLEVTDGTP